MRALCLEGTANLCLEGTANPALRGCIPTVLLLWLQRYAVGNAVVHSEVASTFRQNLRCSVRPGSQGFLENILNHKAQQFYGWRVNYICHVNPCLILDVSSSEVQRRG